MDAQISDEIKEHYDSILNYTIDLTYDWWTYRTLFGHSEDRLKLLQEYTSHFFRVVHDALLEKVILGIARLQDPSKSCGRDNHSCEYFVNECEKHGLQNLAALLSDALADARASAKKITQYRHKRVAHRDVSLRHSDTLSPGSRAEIAEVIACHQRFMQLACNSFQPDTELGWDIISHSDAESIVAVLKGYFAFQRFERDDWQKAREYEDHEFRDA